jgi:hypothetical protein
MHIELHALLMFMQEEGVARLEPVKPRRSDASGAGASAGTRRLQPLRTMDLSRARRHVKAMYGDAGYRLLLDAWRPTSPSWTAVNAAFDSLLKGKIVTKKDDWRAFMLNAFGQSALPAAAP